MDQDIISTLSFWEYQYLFHQVDYTVIGAGIVGLATAIELKENNPTCKVLILDKRSTPIGASTRNAGFACFGSVSEILDDIEEYGEETAKKLILMRCRGLEILKSRVDSTEMDYQDQPGVEIFETEQEEAYYSGKLDYINSLIASILEEKQAFSGSKGILGYEISNRLEGSLNPQKMMAVLELKARNLGVVMLQSIHIEQIIFSSNQLMTNVGIVDFQKLIVCANGFSKSLLPNIDIEPARNQVLISKPIDGFRLDGCYHMHKGYVYFREVEHRLLIGGGRHLDKKGEMTTTLGTTDEIIHFLKSIAETRILNGSMVEWDRKWSGILGVGKYKMPIVKYLNNHVLIAVRMGGMGVAVGSYIGRVAASILLAKDNRDLRLYVSD